MDTVKLKPGNEVSSVVENQAHPTGGHSGAKSLAISEQFSVGACLIAVFQERRSGICELGAKAPQKCNSISGWKE